MGKLKKKKNIIILTMCVAVSFILYQLYFFLAITSEPSNKIIPVFDHEIINNIIHLRSDDDRFINKDGIIKGVFYTHMPKYRADSNDEFKCLKSEQKIAFEKVNDDYCDCEDASDEPSTNACINGTFYCDTQSHKQVIVHQVPSSQVNDGICDCCDGSDEWISKPNQKFLSQTNNRHYRYYVTKCPNVCK